MTPRLLHCQLVLLMLCLSLGSNLLLVMAQQQTPASSGSALQATVAPESASFFRDEERIPLVASHRQSSTDTRENSRLKVCAWVEPSPFTYVSGYANRYQALCRSLVDDWSDDIRVVTAEAVHKDPPKSWKPTDSSPHSVPIHYTCGMPCPGYRLLTLSFDWTWMVPRILLKHRPHVIHVSTPGFIVFPALFWSRFLQIPIVISYHTDLPKYVECFFSNLYISRFCKGLAWLLIRMVLRFADLVLVTSPQIQDKFDRHAPGLECRVWQKGIDTDRFNPRNFCRNMRRRMMGYQGNNNEVVEPANQQEDDNVFLLVYVGRISSEKSLKDLKPILQQLNDSPVNSKKTCLCFVGVGPIENELRAYFAGTPTVFLGQLHGEELSRAFASGDAFVFPSTSETLGFVALESMASGVPVVGANAGGIPNLICHEYDGFLANNVPEFVTYLRQLQANETLRQDMADRAVTEMQQWSWSSSMAKLRNDQYKLAWERFQKRPEQRLWRFLTFQAFRAKKKNLLPPWKLANINVRSAKERGAEWK